MTATVPAHAPLVIVGSGLAGYQLAREWRKLDSQTPLLIISQDDARAYAKPMLSTGLAKDKSADQLVQAEAGAMAEQLQAQIRSHTQVTAIDPAQRQLWLGNECLTYRDLVLACGAEALRPDLSGDAADCLFTVNDLQDYARFRQALHGKQRVLILGAGLIGCEFANDLLLGGYQPCLVAPAPQVMPGLLPAPSASCVQEALAAAGAEFHLGRQLVRLEHARSGLCASLDDGRQLHADLLLAAIGLRPRTRLASQAGLAVGRGIQVDRLLRSSQPHVYALGDCAEVAGHSLLYVMPLMAAARALARTLAGEPTQVSYGAMPITVKTPACPLLVAPPSGEQPGQWQFTGQAPDLRGEYRSRDGRLLGYALCGSAVQDKLALNRELPALLA